MGKTETNRTKLSKGYFTTKLKRTEKEKKPQNMQHISAFLAHQQVNPPEPRLQLMDILSSAMTSV